MVDTRPETHAQQHTAKHTFANHCDQRLGAPGDASTHPSLRANPNPAPTETLDLTQRRVGAPLETRIDPESRWVSESRKSIYPILLYRFRVFVWLQSRIVSIRPQISNRRVVSRRHRHVNTPFFCVMFSLVTFSAQCFLLFSFGHVFQCPLVIANCTLFQTTETREAKVNNKD